MRVRITLDKYDGSQSKLKSCDMENISMPGLILSMMARDVCGITITKDVSLDKMIKLTEGDNE